MTVPLVALHGFTGTPRAFAPLGVEVAWAPALSGHGPDPDCSARTFDEEVARLIRGIQKRFERPVSLLGYSMGARVALGLLLAAPELFSAVTLLGVNPGLETEDARQERLAWEARWIDVLEQDGLAVFEYKWSRLPLFRSQDSLPPASQEAQRTQRLSHTAAGLSHALTVLGLGSMPNYWPRLGEIRLPLRVVAGAQDEKFLSIAGRLCAACPRAESVTIPEAGHNPLLEAPDAVTASLLLEAPA